MAEKLFKYSKLNNNKFLNLEPKFTKVKICRVCNSKNLIDLDFKKKFFLANLDKEINLGYSICKDCKFIFQSEYVGDEFLNYYYERSPMLRRKDPTNFEIDQNIRQSAFINRNINIKNKNVLEIGAHAGAFLCHLNKFYACNCFYDELSEEARKILSSQKGLKDFRVNKSKKIDLIVLRHVLEHIFDLKSFLNNLKNILATEGSLYIEVPDWTYYDCYTDPLIFEHLSQFNSQNISRLLEKNGFFIEAQEKSICAEDPATPNRVIRIIAKLDSHKDNLSLKNKFQDFASKQLLGWINELNKIINKNKQKKIALYPASHLTFDALLNSNLQKANVIGMYDLNEKKHGKSFLNTRVFKPEKLKVDNPDIIFIFTLAYEPEIRESFNRMGLKSEIISINDLIKKNNSL